MLDPGSRILDPGFRIHDPESWNQVPGPEILDPSSLMQDLGEYGSARAVDGEYIYSQSNACI